MLAFIRIQPRLTKTRVSGPNWPIGGKAPTVESHTLNDPMPGLVLGENSNAVKTAAVPLTEQLVNELRNAGVRYCHWKSNRQLDISLRAEEDLDLLIAIEDKAEAQKVLSQLAFKQFIQVPRKRFNAITDIIGFDEESGKLIHLHTHFRLTLGERFIKGYRLPWQDEVLRGTKESEDSVAIFIPAPEVELLLLIIRNCLRARLWSRLAPRSFDHQLEKYFYPDRAWLMPQIEEKSLMRLNAKWLDAQLWPQVHSAATAQMDTRGFLKLRKKVVRLLSPYRTYSPFEAVLRNTLRNVGWAFGNINKRRLHLPRPWGRSSTSGGIIVCVIGADGAGKSTLVRELVHWLGYKIDALPVYMGSGDGPGSAALGVLKIFRRLFFDTNQRRKVDHATDQIRIIRDKSTDPLLWRMARLVWGISLAFEKKKKLKLAYRAASRGIVVIADRYPQAQIFGFNDGPLLRDFESSNIGVFRAIARWELDVYRMSEQMSPDLVIKLMVPIETAIERKPEMRPEEIERRNAAVENISFPPRTHVARIRADLPLEIVILQAKKLVWSLL